MEHDWNFSTPYNGYTEDNMDLRSALYMWLLALVSNIWEVPEMARENHIVDRWIPLESKGDLTLKVARSWRGVKF